MADDVIILWARGTWNLVMLVYLAYIMYDSERTKECKSVSREASKSRDG